MAEENLSIPLEGKPCTYCHVWKFYKDYHKNKKHLDGHDNYCKECRKAIYKKKGYYVRKGSKNRKKPIVTKVIDGVTFKFKHCTSCKVWKNINQFHKFGRMSDGLEIYCKACRKESVGDYFKSEEGKANSNRARNKRRSYNQQLSFSPLERYLFFERDKWLCQHCGCKVHDNENSPNKAHLDHIIPLSKGGKSEPNNLQTLCRTCNLSKGNKIGDSQISLF